MSSTTTIGDRLPAKSASRAEHRGLLIPLWLIWAMIVASCLAAWYVVIWLTLELIG